jgi:hypothetical protein
MLTSESRSPASWAATSDGWSMGPERTQASPLRRVSFRSLAARP